MNFNVNFNVLLSKYIVHPLVKLKTLLNVRYTECPRRNGQNFGKVSLMLNYTDVTQNTYIQS